MRAAALISTVRARCGRRDRRDSVRERGRAAALQEQIGTMEHQELLNGFSELLDEYAKHRDYIRRARAQADRFSPQVIEKVVLDHEIKSSEVADKVLPKVPEMESAIAGIDEEIAGIKSANAESSTELEELELRRAIGELDDAGFEEASKELREKLDAANARLAELEAERKALGDALDRWVEMAAEANQPDGTTPAEPEGVHTSSVPIQEDVSPVYDSAETVEAEEAPEDEAIEAGDEVDFGFEAEAGEVDVEAAAPAAEVELDLEEGRAIGQEGEEIGIDIESAVEEPAPEPEEEPRRALLLYKEGTAEEQIYPIHGEVLRIGRGRDNDLQIKDDSKVSRFHCRLFRRGNSFYIEDNKSSNGTLVNGELIQERRLFGGEEIIIGETNFRFRIL